MPNQGPVFSKLHSLIQQGLRRCLASGSDSSSGQRSSFHDWCDLQQPQQTCHTALELHEVLIQVFKHLDSQTLCTAIPLVCHYWKAAAASDQIWAPLCDPLLLTAVQQQVPAAAQTPSTATDAGFPTAPPLSTPLDTATGLSENTVQSTAAAVPTNPCYSVALPLLHHAVYRYNLLRNPTFLEAANADYSSALQRVRNSSSSAGGKPHAVLTADQRKFAWVTTVGMPSWEVAPAASAHALGSFQPPLPLEYPLTPTSSSSRLQDWLFGSSSKTAPNATAASAAKSSSGSNGNNCSSSGSIGESNDAASLSNGALQQEDVQGVSFLATGSNWTEVVQVVDVMGELTARGFSASTAASILDQGVLAICLTFWVAAAPDTPAPHSMPQAAAAAVSTDAENLHLQAATAPGSLRMQVDQSHQQSPAQFSAALMLDGGQVPLRSFQTFVRNDSSHHFFSKRLAVDPADGWRRYAYVVPCCPRGLRRAVVLLRGRGTGPGSNAAMAALAAGSNGSSSGTGGVQFACVQLRFIRHDEVEGIAAEDCLAGWQNRVVHGF